MKQETKNKISKAKTGTIPWNKGRKDLQVAWNKGVVGSKSGKKNGMYKDGMSANGYLARKELLAGRKRSERCEVCYSLTLTDFDHNHLNGVFRGWLCRRCNLVLGMVKDSQSLLRQLSKYLDLQSEETRPKAILNLYAISKNNSDNQDTEAEQED